MREIQVEQRISSVPFRTKVNMTVGRFEPVSETLEGVDGLASLAEITMVVVVEDNVIDVDQSSVDRRFKLSFVVSFHDHQLPKFKDAHYRPAAYWTVLDVVFALLMI